MTARLDGKVAIVTGGAAGLGLAFGGLDVLVNNAAVFATLTPTPLEAIAEAEWDRVMAVNVKGIWNCVRAALPAMQDRGGGRIVNVASAIAAKGTPGLLHYATSKGADLEGTVLASGTARS